MQIGLITRLGPAASIAYDQRLTETAAERGRVLNLTMVEANVREVSANNLAGRKQEQAEIFARLLQRLKAAGADMVAQGAEAIALAGTDLLLAFDGRDPGYPVIDALAIHAAVLADLATDRVTLADLGL